MWLEVPGLSQVCGPRDGLELESNWLCGLQWMRWMLNIAREWTTVWQWKTATNSSLRNSAWLHAVTGVDGSRLSLNPAIRGSSEKDRIRGSSSTRNATRTCGRAMNGPSRCMSTGQVDGGPWETLRGSCGGGMSNSLKSFQTPPEIVC